MDKLSQDILNEELNTCGLTDYEIVYMDSIDSTNRYAMENADNGSLRNDVNNLIVADGQSAGRGRLGRSFESGAGKGIFASLVIRPQKHTYDIANITLVAALAVSRALDEVSDLKTMIKWPNDIILNGKKLCGILTEMRNDKDKVRFVVVGIGINVNNEEFSQEIKGKATSVYMETGQILNRGKLIALVVKKFEELYCEYLKEKDLSFMKDEYNGRLINKGSQIMVEYKGKKTEAAQLGIDDDGVLKVLIGGEERSITTGEILVRGVHGYV